MRSQAMTEQAFFVLTALVGEPCHGYGIVGEVAELSAGRVQLKVGTLYGVLERLVGDSLVELDREEIWQGRLRRYYRLTERGRDALAAEAERQAANARAAAQRLSVHRPAGARSAIAKPRPSFLAVHGLEGFTALRRAAGAGGAA